MMGNWKSVNELACAYGISVSTIYRYEKKTGFPAECKRYVKGGVQYEPTLFAAWLNDNGRPTRHSRSQANV